MVDREIPFRKRQRRDDSTIDALLVEQEDPSMNLFDPAEDADTPVEPEETESEIIHGYELDIPDESQLVRPASRDERAVCTFYSSDDNEEHLRNGEEGLLESDVRHADRWEEALDRFEEKQTLSPSDAKGLVGLLMDCYERMPKQMKTVKKREIVGSLPSINGLGEYYRKDVVVQTVKYATSKAGLTPVRERELISSCYPDKMSPDAAKRFAKEFLGTYFGSEGDFNKVRRRVNYSISSQERSILHKDSVTEIVMSKTRDYLVEKCPETIRGKNNLARFVENILSTYYDSQESIYAARDDVLGGMLLMDRKRRAFGRTEAVTAIGNYLSGGPLRNKYKSC